VTAVGMVLAGLGLTLVWCGIRDEDPRAVIAGVFTKNAGTTSPGVVGRIGAPSSGVVGRIGAPS
jgi:hypothetical protein